MFADAEWAASRRQPATPTVFYVENGAAVARPFNTLAELADHIVARAGERTLLAPRRQVFGYPDFDTIDGFGIYAEGEDTIFMTVAIQRRPMEHLVAAIQGAAHRVQQRRAA
jgi:hypothetical protein